MSSDYAVTKIKEALELSKGNAARARQIVIAWCHEDSKLLHALARPHITGIVAYQVDRVNSGRADAQLKKIKAQKEPQAELSGQAAEAAEQVENFGQEILKALSGGSGGATFGTEAYGGQPLGSRPKGASKSHIDAIKMMAAKSSVKKD